MIDSFRYVLATLLFCLGVYLLVDLVVTGFDGTVLIAAIVSFILAHYIQPTRNSTEDSNVFFDILDAFIHLPFRAISVFLRTLWRPFKSDGVDLDIG